MDDLLPPGGPAFLNPERAAEIAYPTGDEVPRFDYELTSETPDSPSLGVQGRYREIARLHAAGQTNNQICAALGYTPSRLSIILRDPFVRAEVQRWRDLMFSGRAADIIKHAAEDAAREIHRIILDPSIKETTRLDAAKFAVEKVTGKAKQEVSVTGGDINYFINIKQEMIQRGELVDVTPQVPAVTGEPSPAAETAGPERWTRWLDAELG